MASDETQVLCGSHCNHSNTEFSVAGKVYVSHIVDFLRHTTCRSSEDSGLDELCNMLDPEHKDISIDLDTYHAIMKEWIDDCRNQGYEDVLVCPSLEQWYVKMYNCTFLRVLLIEQGKKCWQYIAQDKKKKKQKKSGGCSTPVNLVRPWSVNRERWFLQTTLCGMSFVDIANPTKDTLQIFISLLSIHNQFWSQGLSFQHFPHDIFFGAKNPTQISPFHLGRTQRMTPNRNHSNYETVYQVRSS